MPRSNYIFDHSLYQEKMESLANNFSVDNKELLTTNQVGGGLFDNNTVIDNNNNTNVTISKQCGGGLSSVERRSRLLTLEPKFIRTNEITKESAVMAHSSKKRPKSTRKDNQKGKGLCAKRSAIRCSSIPHKKKKSANSKKKKSSKQVKSKLDIFS